ncbi:MAG: hypothetical protein LC781_20025, partial [Actinobacteria bacterium]|nr:hypothetical protein [Actinomycetota bacterium]
MESKERLTEDLVEIPVPKRHLMEVYRLIGTLEAKESQGEAIKADMGDVEAVENGDWSPNELRMLYDQSPPAMIKLLDCLADNGDRWVPIRELNQAVYGEDDSGHKLGGALGAFGRRVKNRHRKPWPFKVQWGHEEQMLVYFMDSWT